jgi:tetratricopeptide (TPR) repeat protein
MKKLVLLLLLAFGVVASAALATLGPPNVAFGKTGAASATRPQGGATPDASVPDAAAVATAKQKREASQRKLELAHTYVKAGAWDQAIEAYSEAADSEDPTIASKARAGLLESLNAKDAGALGLRAKLPPPASQWWMLDYFVYAIGIVVLAIALAPIAMAARWLLRRFIRLFKKRASRSPWRVSVSGSAEEPDRSMVFDEFVITMRGLRQTGQSVRALSSVSLAEARFFTPLSLTDLVGPDLVIQGVDISRIAAMAQRLMDYFSYGFELRVDKLGSHAYAYASLRWGGRVEKTWQIPSFAEGTQFNFREIGRQLAFAIHGDGLVRR